MIRFGSCIGWFSDYFHIIHDLLYVNMLELGEGGGELFVFVYSIALVIHFTSNYITKLLCFCVHCWAYEMVH